MSDYCRVVELRASRIGMSPENLSHGVGEPRPSFSIPLSKVARILAENNWGTPPPSCNLRSRKSPYAAPKYVPNPALACPKDRLALADWPSPPNRAANATLLRGPTNPTRHGLRLSHVRLVNALQGRRGSSKSRKVWGFEASWRADLALTRDPKEKQAELQSPPWFGPLAQYSLFKLCVTWRTRLWLAGR